MKQSLKLIGLTCAAVVATVYFQYRDQLIKVPRVRVGPLVQSVPLKDPAELQFFVLGDTGTGGEAQYKVAEAMEKRCRELTKLDGIILLGDNSYQAGFQSVDDPDWQSKVEVPYGSSCLSTAPIYPILGNHDYKGHPAAQVEYSLVNARWRMPNRFYGFRFGSLLNLVAYDSQTLDLCGIPAFCSIDFLWDQTQMDPRRQTISWDASPEQKPSQADEGPDSGKSQQWTMVMGHHPLVSASVKGFDHAGGFRGWIFKQLFCQRVDVWLAGHAHHMEHRIPRGCRLEHYVLGGGGASLYGVIDDGPDVKFAKSTYGFAEFTVRKESIVTRFFNDQGQQIYETLKQRATEG